MILQQSQNNRVKNVVKRFWLVTCFTLAGLFVGIRPLHAADAVVGTGTPASCTEGAFDAALFAVQNGGGGTVTFNCGPSIHFIEFFAGSTGKIINTPVVINADNKIVLNAYNERRHFYVASNGSLTLQNITLVQGRSNTDNGGSIYNLGTLILEGAIILDSNVGADYSGGAIVSNGGPVTITNSRLENNTGGSVGGLYLVGESADATITNSIFRNNRTTNTTYGLGGAITTWDGADVTIRNSTLEGNQARQGGAIYNQFAATTITIDANSKMITNTATFTGGAISNLLGTITISDSTLSGNAVQAGDDGGGGIYNFGNLTLTNSTLAGNSAPFGGGVHNNGGSVTLTNTTVVSNAGTTGGGGIYNVGTITLTNSTVAGNTSPFGGGVNNNSGSVTLTNTTVVSNTGANDGGGIFNVGSLTVTNSTVAGNTASFGGGVRNRGGSVILTNSTVVSNTGAIDGGGIYNFGNLTLTNSTVAGNTAPFGGGVRNNGGGVTLTNSTIAANTATNQGGGIYNFGTFILTNGTVAGNTAATGGGIYNVLASSVVTLTNSIIANSLNGHDCSSTGTIVSQGYSLDSDNTCNLTATGDITNTNPLLGPLQDNGGATLTRGLLVGSPAIDPIPNGSNGCGATIASDQRGVIRPQGLGCDMGAFEAVYVNQPPVANGQTVTTTVNTAKAITLTASDADNDALTYTVTISPTHGTLSGTAPTVTYTPNAGFRGSDSFSFRVNDGKLDSATAAVTILVGEQGNPNRPPVAVTDAVTVTAGVAVTISVLANDSDPDGDALTVTINQPPQHGSAVVNGVTIVYTPQANFNGADSLTYTITDSKGASAGATITITVQPQPGGAAIYLPLISQQ